MRQKSESWLCLKHIHDYASSSVNRRLSGSYSISKSCAVKTKGVIFVGLKIQKMEHHASLPRFSFRGLLSFTFSAETILFRSLEPSSFRSCRNWKQVWKAASAGVVKVLGGVLLLLMSRGMFEWTFISLLHTCV